VSATVKNMTAHIRIMKASHSAISLAWRTDWLPILFLALAVFAAFSTDTAHVFGDGFGDTFGHFPLFIELAIEPTIAMKNANGT
jgi:hypothetical protein